MKLDLQRIQMIMAERQMSKGALSRLMGIAGCTLTAKFRRGRCSPSSAGRMAEALEVPVAEIAEPEIETEENR